PELDPLARRELVARVVHHRLADVGGDEARARIEAVAQVRGDKPGAAADLEHVARRFRGQARGEVAPERVEPRGSQVAVVVARHRAGEVRLDVHRRDVTPRGNLSPMNARLVIAALGLAGCTATPPPPATQTP